MIHSTPPSVLSPPRAIPHTEEPIPGGAASSATCDEARRATSGWPPILLATGLAFVALLVAVGSGLLLQRGGLARPTPPPRPAPGAQPASEPLHITSVALGTQQRGTLCAVVGDITTNAQPGIIAYRWRGTVATGPIMGVTAPDDQNHVEVLLFWDLTAHPPAPDDSATVAGFVSSPRLRHWGCRGWTSSSD